MKKNRDFEFKIKAAKKGGFISGYASVFGVIDSYKERVLPGAFDETLADAKAKGRKIPVLYQHNDLIGSWDVMEPDDVGLYCETNLPVDKVRLAAEAHALAMDGGLTGISIGFEYRESILHEESGIRDLVKVWLWESSLVTFPANDESRIIEVRRKLDAGELPTITEFERSLRDSGFTRKQATVIAAKGYRALLSDSDSEADAYADVLLKKLRGFNLQN